MPEHAAGIVDQDLDIAISVQDARHEGEDRVPIAYIDKLDLAAARQIPAERRCRLKFVADHIAGPDRRAQGRECASDRPAKAMRRARHDDRLAVKA